MVVEAARIENTTSETIDIGPFEFHQSEATALRHADDHVHLVTTLIRQDGRTVWAWNDYRSAQAAARDLEDRYGLHRVGPDRPTP